LSHQFHLICRQKNYFRGDEEVQKENDARYGGVQKKRIEDRKCKRIS
jgi:hypothetical protein